MPSLQWLEPARVPRLLCRLALGRWMASCGSAAGTAGDDGACESDDDCVGAICVDGTCAADDAGTVDTVEDDTTEDVPGEDTTPDTAPDTTPDVAPDTGPDDGTIGAPCESDEDCDSGYCIGTADGPICTEQCAGTCPDGYECRLLDTGSGDVVELCVPTIAVLCRPCTGDVDCGSLDNLCITLTDGTFCGVGCDDDSQCPEGFTCEDTLSEAAGDVVGQCVNDLGICGDCFDPDGDGFGIGSGCFGGDCDELDTNTYDGASELCDGIDNDCDDDIDEGFDLTSDARHCGACDNACVGLEVADGACVESACVVVECEPGFWDIDGRFSNGCEYACTPNEESGGVEICNTIDDDCDGQIDEDFDLSSDPLNCRSCGRVCASEGGEAACVEGECTIGICTEPFADCNLIVEDGCEVDTDNDADNCSACGEVCSLPQAVPVCVEGACVVGSCEVGWEDCNGDPTDGCEVNTGADVTECGACGAPACDFDNGSAACVEGACVLTACDDDWGDCDGLADNGCEEFLRFNNEHCGTCDNLCALDGAESFCNATACDILRCEDGREDCNLRVEDGCETNIATSLSTCGACDAVCSLPQAAEACVAGECELGMCDSGWGNCDDRASNGCETTLIDNDNHCGACGNVCAFDDGVGACVGETCELTGCDAGFDNCDDDIANGCETPTRFDNENCGGCDVLCDPANAIGACVDGVCTIIGCLDGWDNCNGLAADGCETDIWNSLTTCGACTDSVCSLPQAEEACVMGTCTLVDCDEGWDDCDPLRAGCETNVVDNDDNCGACFNACDIAGGIGACNGTVCELADCIEPLADCDELGTCATNTDTSLEHCGGCGLACDPFQGTGLCVSGACTVDECNAPWQNCDNLVSNGCEADTSTSLAHCGGCFVACELPNAITECTPDAGGVGSCGFVDCQPGWVDLDEDPFLNGCEYECTRVVGVDAPEPAGTVGADQNCDGVDGDVDNALFVRAGGSDDNDGRTPDTPLATIGAALEIAEGDPGVFYVLVAIGAYEEDDNGPIELVSGVSLYGGYSADFTRRTTTNSSFTADADRAVVADGLFANVTIDRINLITTDATSQSGDRGTVRVNNSGSRLALSNLTVRAGRGGDGRPGSSGVQGGEGGDGTDGSDSTGGDGGAGGGGDGADGRSRDSGPAGSAGAANTGTAGTAGSGSGSGGLGCRDGNPRDGGNGGTGGTGSAGTDGSRGTGLGVLSGIEWSPTHGTNGANGGRGGGGGGGGAGGGEDCSPVGCGFGFCGTGRGGGGGGGGGDGGTEGTAGTSGGA